ncbi:Clan CA, family C19, ubiquitin hydrolase-like cysteine peptidase [Trichomonas vaginalis G3]|uniref:Clan CA, family C19, ubiquitin hydrolase-like cysteine peptidase n=1 Tax=Trichomonas vaginalis (strain ATCC PRA-98 / G3) TaxID=412133 RepID=A2ECN2_TRIV3|nr:ubiquitinyl hydrolase protein [Trichomonas vaginalis G3]EAY09629.1 Clan CA, family C19, ubiquitin hydrolase-like cysteine peptidase [Trichomonas vaginalis G3]KAI5502140.1 ubiquitinyl hydrolase protein [Trichomonas vaginalis G3]|eukprot:XP_001321852.1 Clan CA, family C19, ubiquitin hydrolase-like cysteine peptidase [Trichomonas vaginalis G3]
MQDYDPDTLCAVLTISLDEGTGYAAQLNKLSSFLEQAKMKGLPEPYQDLTEILVYESFPPILTKVLQLESVTTTDEMAILAFIKTAIGIIMWSFTIKKKYTLLKYLSQIFDPSMPIYIYNGRKQNLPYSSYMTDFANNAKQKYIHVMLFSAMGKDLSIDELVSVFDVIRRLCMLLGTNAIFNKIDNQVQSINQAITNILSEQNDRNLHHKQIIQIYEYIFECVNHPLIVDCACNVVNRFITSDIVEVKMSGFRLSQIIFTKAITGITPLTGSQTNLLAAVSKNANSIEQFEVIKPIFINFAKHNHLSPVLIKSLYESVKSQHASILNKCEIIFADIALNLQNPDIILEFQDLSPNILGRLLEGHQYARVVSIMLWSNIRDNSEVFETLTKTASRADLGDLIPKAVELSSEKNFTEKSVTLIDKILSNTKTVFNPSTLVDQVIEHENLESMIMTLVSIMSRSKSHFSAGQLSKIFEKLTKESQTKFFKQILPDIGLSLVDQDSIDPLLRIINQTEDIEILRHCYINLQYSNANPILITTVFNAAYEKIWQNCLKNDEQSMKLLLEVKEPHNLPSKVMEITNKAISVLQTKSDTALKLLSDCLNLCNEYISPLSLNYKPHKVSFDNELITIKVTYQIKNFTINCLKNESVRTIKPLAAKSLDVDEQSIVIYHNKSVVKDGFVRDLTPPEIEIRIKNEYDKGVHFTLKNHPITILKDHVNELFQFLSEENLSLQCFNVLQQLPTPTNYKIDNLKYSEPYRYLYQLQYIYCEKEKNQALIPGVKEIFENNFELLLPESKLISLFLISEPSEKMIGSLLKLVQLPNDEYFVKLSDMLIKLVENLQVDLEENDLKVLLFDERRNFVEKLLKTKLIKNQNFSKIWTIFNSLQNYAEHVYIFTEISVPLEMAGQLEQILRNCDIKNSEVLTVLADLCDRWNEFPISIYSERIMNDYILCKNKNVNVNFAPFQFILSMMKRSEEFKQNTINSIFQTLPMNSPWGYTPSNEMKSIATNRCGLNNLGATCYINSLIQILFSIEPFRNFIISTKFDDEGLNYLHILFTKLMYSDSHYVDMKEFTSRWKDYDGQPVNVRQQQDCHDFLLQLFSKLENYPIMSLFTGLTIEHFIGLTNDFHSERSESFPSLSIPIKDITNIDDSLKLFCTPETIEDYRDEKYPEKFNIQRYTTIEKLPPILIIQLKRFDYSVETGMRTKIDSIFEVPDEFEINGKKLSLIGTVVHQGDAEVGHYISYLKGEKWMNFNDQSTKFVFLEEAKSANSGVGEYGTSAYLLFYKNNDYKEDFGMEIKVDEEIINQIKIENDRLIIDKVYYSKQFVDFICHLVDYKECNQIVINYFMKVLSHSDDNESFAKLSQKILEKFDENHLFNDSLEVIQNELAIIKYILVYSTNKEIRNIFTQFMKQIFTRMGSENDLMITIFTFIYEWEMEILQNWRNSFDIFSVLEVFTEISRENCQFLLSIDADQFLIKFVTEEVPTFVNNKQNQCSAERFKRLSDFSHLINTLVNLKVPKAYLTKDFMKWVISSEKIGDAIINMIVKLKIDNVEKFIDIGVNSISEELVIDLIAKTDFMCPRAWLESGPLCSPESYSRMARCLSTVDDLSSFTLKNYELMGALLFAKNQIVVQEAINSIKVNRRKNKQNKQFFGPFFREINYIPIYSRNFYKTNQLSAAGSFDNFNGFQLLRYLTDEINSEENSEIEITQQDVEIVVSNLEKVVKVGGKFDAHTVCMVELATSMCMTNNSKIEKNEIERVIEFSRKAFDVIDIKCSHRDYAINSYLKLLEMCIQKTRISVDQLMPENNSNLLVELIFRQKYNKSFIDFCKECTKRYANSTRLYKIVCNGLFKEKVTTNQLYEILTMFKKDVVTANSMYLLGKTESIKYLIEGITKLDPNVDYFDESLLFVENMMYNATHQVYDIMLKNNKIVESFFRMASSQDMKKGKSHIVKILSFIIEFGGENIDKLFMSDQVIGSELDERSRDEWVSSLLLLICKLWIDKKPPNSLLVFLGREMSTHFRQTNDILNMRATLNSLVQIKQNINPMFLDVFFDVLHTEKVIHLPWRLKCRGDETFEGLFAITMTIVMKFKDRELLDNLSKAAEISASNSPFHAKLKQEISKL